MWAFVVLATLLALLAGCWSFEVGVVVALCSALWWCMTKAPGSAGGSAGGSSATCPRTSARRSTRSARVATNVDRKRRRRPIVREALVQRVPLQAVVPEGSRDEPPENFLDACMLEQQHKRSQSLDARHYHSSALPNAIRAAALELTTADPAIVPLDDGEVCVRPLGEV